MKRNKQLLEETQLQYFGEFDEAVVNEYQEVEEFLEELYIEGICDEIELRAYEELSYKGSCNEDDLDYVKETMKLWCDGEYYRRLSIVNGD